MEKKKSIVWAIAAVLLIAMVGSASANCVCDDGYCNNVERSYYTCGDTVTESCTFNADMSCPYTGGLSFTNRNHALTIGADNVVIEGAGHTLDGVAPGVCNWNHPTYPSIWIRTRAGIANHNYSGDHDHRGYGYNNVTINNLTVSKFCYGMFYRGGPDQDDEHVENCTIYNCTIRDNGNVSTPQYGTYGILFYWNVDNSTIDDCEVCYNTGSENIIPPCEAGGMGIQLWKACDYNNITNNYIHHNYHAGICSKACCKHLYIAHNNVTQNSHYDAKGPSGGIVGRCIYSDHWVIEHNNITDNYGPGIFTGGSRNVAQYNNISGCKNKITGSNYDLSEGYGVWFPGRSEAGDGHNELYWNVICDNENTDIVSCYPIGHPYQTTGDDNTCTSARDYADEGCTSPPCTYLCPGASDVDLAITGKMEEWNPQGQHDTYTVRYTVTNLGALTSVATTTSIKIDGHEVATDPVGPLASGQSHTRSNLGPFPVNTSVPVNGAGYIDNVTVCADKNNVETRDTNEANDCMWNIFGGPDLVITQIDWTWDAPQKDFTLHYTVINNGNNVAAANTLSATLMDGSHQDVCTKTVTVPQLIEGTSTSFDVGPFTMPGDHCFIDSTVDCNNVVPENDETNNQRFITPSFNYPGCCDVCGDVNCDNYVDVDDNIPLREKVSHPETTLDCEWAGDVNGDDYVDVDDIIPLREKVSHPETTLNCCGGSCPP